MEKGRRRGGVAYFKLVRRGRGGGGGGPDAGHHAVSGEGGRCTVSSRQHSRDGCGPTTVDAGSAARARLG
jgi:hypothetical protein